MSVMHAKCSFKVRSVFVSHRFSLNHLDLDYYYCTLDLHRGEQNGTFHSNFDIVPVIHIFFLENNDENAHENFWIVIHKTNENVPTLEQNKTILKNFPIGVRHSVDVNLGELHICKKK